MRIVQAKLIGGFGNQLFQYVAARKYAEMYDAVLEVPEWCGRKLFNLNEPYPSRELPCRNDGGSSDIANAVQWGEVNIQLGGYFQMQSWVKHWSRKELKKWLQIDPKWLNLLQPSQKPYIAAHLRQGDYINHPLFCNIHPESYLHAVVYHDLFMDNFTWVEQDSPRGNYECTMAGMPFLPDFVWLMRANWLLRANSTFSWWAATLSDTVEVYSPVVEDRIGLQRAKFVKGNHPKFAHVRTTGIQIDDLYLPD